MDLTNCHPLVARAIENARTEEDKRNLYKLMVEPLRRKNEA